MLGHLLLSRLEAQVKNDRGNLPLHTAASFRAPLEVAEALLEAYPEAASITNNYGNLALHFTAWKKGPLDLAIADGASPNVVALLQGKTSPPSDDEVFDG